MPLVASWNIEHGRDIDAAAEFLTSSDEFADFDVLLAQELDDAGASELARHLDAEHVYAASGVHTRTGRPFGNAVFSRHGLAPLATIPLPGRAPVGGHPRVTTGATVVIDGVPWQFFSAHTETPALPLRFRRRQYQRLAAASRSTALPTIVGGDFNTVTSRSRRLLAADLGEFGLQPLMSPDSHDPTCRRWRTGFVLDHLFGRGVNSLDSGVAQSLVSDHEPIWVRVDPSTEPSGHGQ